MMDITPLYEIVNSLRHQGHTWKILFAELVDNSFDAGAARAEILLGPGKKITVIDDGNGCSDIAAMLRLGGKQRHRTTVSGRYGVGLKEVAIQLWGKTTIQTVAKTDGRLRRIAIDWPSLNGWLVSDPIEEEPDGNLGTNIQFSNISKIPPVRDQVCEDLGYLFSPAILKGKQIIVVRGAEKRQ